MHGTGLSPTTSRNLTVEFRKHLPKTPSFGKVKGVTAVGAKQEIRMSQALANADRDRLLADRQMNRALNFVRRIHINNPLFNQTDSQGFGKK